MIIWTPVTGQALSHTDPRNLEQKSGARDPRTLLLRPFHLHFDQLLAPYALPASPHLILMRIERQSSLENLHLQIVKKVVLAEKGCLGSKIIRSSQANGHCHNLQETCPIHVLYSGA